MLHFIGLTIAGFINAFEITVFLAPVKLYESGVTQLLAKGHYSKTEKTAVYFIVNRFQIPNVKEIAHEIDPEAFMTITEVADVYMGTKHTHE